MAVAALTVKAQKGEYYVTPHLNVGMTYLTQMLDNNGMNIGGGLGADFEYMLSDNFGVSAGADLLYAKSTEHVKDRMSSKGYIESIYYDYSFLNIPVMAQYHSGQLALKAGIQPGLTLAARGHDAVETQAGKGKKEKALDGVKKMNISLPIGLSYTFKTPVTLELRCNIPLTLLNTENKRALSKKYITFDSEELEVLNSGDVAAVTAMICIGYRF